MRVFEQTEICRDAVGASWMRYFAGFLSVV